MLNPFKPKATSELSNHLSREGIPKVPRETVTINDLHKASVKLFHFILPNDDFRWRLAFAWDHLNNRFERKVTKINLENALLANYLSKNPSTRTGNFRDVSLPNLLQSSRAISNLFLGHEHFPIIEKKAHAPVGYRLVAEKTGRINKGTDERGVTGCPEALWQLQLFKGKTYLARIGFNFHREGNGAVVSITNLQGAKGHRRELFKFEATHGHPFIFLINQLRSALDRIQKKKKIRFLLRGMLPTNADRPKEHYVKTFEKTKIHAYLESTE